MSIHGPGASVRRCDALRCTGAFNVRDWIERASATWFALEGYGRRHRQTDTIFLGDLVEHIQLTATLPNIAPGDLAKFKELAAQALELTRGEATTLQYDWFFSYDETKCVVRERYENSDAILAHMGNLGELIGKLAELGGGLEIEAFGTPSAELLAAAATAGLQPSVYKFFQGK